MANDLADAMMEYGRKPDYVNHPPHYTNGRIECLDAIQAMTANPKWTGEEAYLLGQVIKYVWRHKDKGGRQDLEKAEFYIKRALAVANEA